MTNTCGELNHKIYEAMNQVNEFEKPVKISSEYGEFVLMSEKSYIELKQK